MNSSQYKLPRINSLPRSNYRNQKVAEQIKEISNDMCSDNKFYDEDTKHHKNEGSQHQQQPAQKQKKGDF